MNKKLWYLTRLSLNKKIKSKWFAVANIIILIVLVGILNIDYVIKLFGGDFDKFTNILVVDNTNYVYNDLENIYNESSKYIDDIKNSTITLSDKTTEELKEDLKDKDIKESYKKKNIFIKGEVDINKIKSLEGIIKVIKENNKYIVKIKDNSYIDSVFKIVSKGKNIQEFYVEDASLNEIFVNVVGENYE